MDGPVLAIEQAATFTRVVVYSRDGRPLASARDEIRRLPRGPGLATLDPEEIWSSVLATCRMALVRARVEPGKIGAIGIANQRDTFVLWDRATGRPVHEAIASDDRRTALQVDALVAAGVGAVIREHTGLRLDPRFAATKIAWLLDNVHDLRGRAERGEIAFGTIDTFLLWRLTDGRVHATDASNAARTLMFDIRRQEWDQSLLRIFDIPEAILPRVFDSGTYFGAVNAVQFGGKGPVSIRAMMADEPARFLGLGCLAPGAAAVSLDEGCAVLVNAGSKPRPAEGLLTTLVFRREGLPVYALEGANMAVGAGIRWLSDGLDVAPTAADVDRLAGSARGLSTARFIPPGLAREAPYWGVDHGGFLDGISITTGLPDLASATQETLAFVVRDLIEAAFDGVAAPADAPVRVDGAVAASDRVMQFLADILGRPVERGEPVDRVALGVARLAGLAAGLGPDLASIAQNWQPERRFEPVMPAAERETSFRLWRRALRHMLEA